MDRRRFARVATLFYIRRYWVAYALAIVIGIAIVVSQRDGLALFVGAVFILYPLTVPIRYSMVVASRASTFLDQETSFELDSNSFFVRNEAGGTTQAQLSAIRGYEVIADTLIMLFGRAAFLMLPLEGLDDETRTHVLERVRSRGI